MTTTRCDSTVLAPRIRRLIQRFLETKPSLSIHRARALTEITKEQVGVPVVLQRARGFYRVCERLPIFIDDDELIVGHAGGKPRAAVVSPDICWRWLHDELDSVATREISPYDLAPEDKRALRDTIIPFWRGRSIDERVYAELRELGILNLCFESGIIDCEVKTNSGGGDLCPGYGNILLAKGVAGIRAEAQATLANLDATNAEDIQRLFFLRAVMIIGEGLVLLANRYGDLAQDQAVSATPTRRAELLEIARSCRRVPEHPPRSFPEALQAIWFGQVGIYLEETNAGTSPGRVDAYVWPFLKADLSSSKLTREQAFEWLCAFLYKFNENTWPLSAFASAYFAGYMPFQNIVVGGQTRDRRDSTNELTFMILEAAKAMKMFQPSISVRVHRDTPQKLWDAIADLIAEGIGFPSIQYDEANIRMLESRGVSAADARDYCVMACTEPHLSGQLVRWASATYTNFPIAIEFALNNGQHQKTGQMLGLATGPLDVLNTWETFEAAVRRQLAYLFDRCLTVTHVVQRAHQALAPKPVGSMLLEGCVESGTDQMFGGSKYHWGPGIIVVGLADYANAMAAIKQLVFDQNVVTIDTVAAACRADFEGHDELYHRCVRAPKYGNDDDRVDGIATDIIGWAGDYISKLQGPLDRLELLTLSVSTNVPQGLVVGALPSGRRAGLPLADGISPAQGTDVNGPTAVIKSVDKIDPLDSSGAVLLNMKIDPSLIRAAEDRMKFIALLKAHGALGGAHIQFNCVCPETLRDAQRHPEAHRDLIVRVAGYSAYFTELTPAFQEEVISRSTQSAI